MFEPTSADPFKHVNSSKPHQYLAHPLGLFTSLPSPADKMSQPLSPVIKSENIQDSSFKTCLTSATSEKKRKAPECTPSGNSAPRRSQRIRKSSHCSEYIYYDPNLPPEHWIVLDDDATDSESDDNNPQAPRKRRRADQTYTKPDACSSNLKSEDMSPEPIKTLPTKPAATSDCGTAAQPSLEDQASALLADTSCNATEPTELQRSFTATVDKFKADHIESIKKLRVEADNLIKSREWSADTEKESLRSELASAKASLEERAKDLEQANICLEKSREETDKLRAASDDLRAEAQGLQEENARLRKRQNGMRELMRELIAD